MSEPPLKCMDGRKGGVIVNDNFAKGKGIRKRSRMEKVFDPGLTTHSDDDELEMASEEISSDRDSKGRLNRFMR
jgi:hypothetical protein